MSNNSKSEIMEEIGDLARRDAVAQAVVDDAACERLGINRTDHRVLDVLGRIGPLSAGRLAEEAGLSPGAMTTAIDRLEAAGHARRVTDQADRRRILVEMTPSAGERAWEIYGPMKEDYFRDMSRYTVKELDLIRDYWRRAVEISEAHAELDAGEPKRRGRKAA